MRLGMGRVMKGMAFEVRSCYQIGDSKRIQADLDMALELRNQNFEPVMLIFCSSSLVSPVKRLSQTPYWRVRAGNEAFGFISALTGFDLYSFLQREGRLIQGLVNRIFDTI